MAKKKTNRKKAKLAAKEGGTNHCYGRCVDCNHAIDVIVDACQVVGPDQLLCVDCRGERLITKATEKGYRIKEKAEKAREEQRQMKPAL